MSSTCNEIEPLLSAWLDDELESADGARITAHVETCGRCQADVEGLRAAARAVGRQFAMLSAEAPVVHEPGRRQFGQQARAAGELAAPVPHAAPDSHGPQEPARRRLPLSRFLPLAAAAALLLLWIFDDQRPEFEPPVEAARALAVLLEAETLELVAENAEGLRVRSVRRRDGSAFSWEEQAGGFAGGGDADEVWLHVPEGGVAWAPREGGAWLPERAECEWPGPFGPWGVVLLEQLELAARTAEESGATGALLAPEGSAWIRASVVSGGVRGARTAELELKGGGTWRLALRAVDPPADFHNPERVLSDPEQARDSVFPGRARLPHWLVHRPGAAEQEDLEALSGLGYLGDD